MTGEASAFRAGAARRDITPGNGGEFFGYARPDKLADGVAIRLFARALVLDDGEGAVALVSADLGAPMVRERVLEHVRPLGFDRDTLLFTCTHTHAGPNDVGEWIAARIGDAVAAAAEDRRPAVAGWGTARVPDANRSRSVEAHLANHGQDHQPGTGTVDLDPAGPDHTRSTTLRLLRVDDADGGHVAAWTQFPVHPTAYTPHNTTFSADLAGVAGRRFVDGFDADAPLALYASGPLGDLIPVYDDYNQHAVADSAGRRIARGMDEAWADAGDRLSAAFPVDGRATTAVYEGQEVADGRAVADEATFGLPFFGGGQNGPSLFYDAGLEGLRRPAADADAVHGRKLLVDSAPWSPEVPVQALRVGDRLLAAYPGEPTTETARRVREAVGPAAPDGVADVAVIAVANGYHGYFTTPEEYDQQHYEGGHTVFGKYTSLLVEQTHVELAERLADGRAERDDAEAAPTGSRPETPPPPVGRGGVDAELTASPSSSVERMDVVAVEWRGGEAGRDRPVDEPFLVLEREAGEWLSVATDLDFGFVWHETGGAYAARYDVPPALPAGTYRLRVRGAGYDLATDAFEVVPSAGLRVRGARIDRHGGGASLAFLAQNPPPDPERNLRTRSVQPRGGSLTFAVDGRERAAEWDADVAGWTAPADGVSRGDVVTVPEGGLVDGLGNRSGGRREVTVGRVRPVEWPPHIGSGGERPPAPDDVAELLEAVQDLLE